MATLNCNICNTEKESQDFYRANNTRGFQGACKLCQFARRKNAGGCSTKNPLPKTCPKCDMVFMVDVSSFGRRKFCSQSCFAKTRTGESHPRWKGGVSRLLHRLRSTEEYKEWRTSVFERDRYVCQICLESPSGHLNAHHIKSFKDHPDLRYKTDNGKTLCRDCHIGIHTIKGIVPSLP